MTTADENADLRKRVAELEKALAPPKVPPMSSDAAYRDEMRAISEQRMNLATNFFTREDLRAFEAAAPTAAVQDIVAKGGISGPSGQIPTSGQVGGVHTASGIVGSHNGWVTPRPLGPQPGIDHVDRLMDEQDRRDKADLAQRLARQK
jgi:hypothetical protein